MKVTKNDLIKRIAKDEGIPTRTVRKLITALFNDIAGELANDNTITIDSFGSFYINEGKGRTLTNPKDGLKKTYKSIKRIGFKPSGKIKPKNQPDTIEHVFSPLPKGYFEGQEAKMN